MLDYNGLHTVDNTCPDDEEFGKIKLLFIRVCEIRSQRLRLICDQKAKRERA